MALNSVGGEKKDDTAVPTLPVILLPPENIELEVQEAARC
jgi:hypothetical protein